MLQIECHTSQSTVRCGWASIPMLSAFAHRLTSAGDEEEMGTGEAAALVQALVKRRRQRSERKMSRHSRRLGSGHGSTFSERLAATGVSLSADGSHTYSNASK